jgi:hypothetical protein
MHRLAASFGSRSVAWMLAIGLLLVAAHAVGHGIGLGPEPITIEAVSAPGDHAQALDEGCALCRNRLQERDLAPPAEAAAATPGKARVRLLDRVVRATSVRLAQTDPARAPPRFA